MPPGVFLTISDFSDQRSSPIAFFLIPGEFPATPKEFKYLVHKRLKAESLLKTLIHFLPSSQRPQDRDLIGVLQVSAHRQAAGQPGDLYIEGL